MEPSSKMGVHRVLDATTPKPQNHIRIVAISDTHGQIDHLSIPEGDIFIDCGDFTIKGSKKQFTNYIQKVNSLPHKHKIIISGNHDLFLDNERRSMLERQYSMLKSFSYTEAIEMLSKCTYLKSTAVSLYGYKIYGTPYTPRHEKYAFYKTKELLKSEWEKIPKDVNILITHSPPKYIGDLTTIKKHAGCEYLLNEVTGRVKPLIHLFGHIHEQYGVFEYKGVTFANCSSCNKKYKMSNQPIIFDLPILSPIPPDH